MGRPTQYQNGGWISYIITTSGPEPLEILQSSVDYEHYVARQLQPVADAILPFVLGHTIDLGHLDQLAFDF